MKEKLFVGLVAVGSFVGGYFSNKFQSIEANNHPNGIPMKSENIQHIIERIEKVDSDVAFLKQAVESLTGLVKKLISIIVTSQVKREIPSAPEVPIISETKQILNVGPPFSISGLFSVFKSSVAGRTSIICSCVVVSFFIFKFATRRKIKFFIGDDFKPEMKLAIIEQLTSKIYMKARFEMVSKPQADIIVVNGDLSLRKDNVVPNDANIYLSICKQSECDLQANEVRINRVNSTIYLDSGAVHKLFALMKSSL